MSKKSLESKIESKRQEWLVRSAAALSIDPEEAKDLLSIERRQSIRINPLKGDPSRTLKDMEDLGWEGEQYSWMAEGYTMDLGREALRDSSLIDEGKIYIQNAASWLSALVLDPKPGDKIIDVCAAPGGKTTHLAAITNNKARITANDNAIKRLHQLQGNCLRLGADIEKFTLYDATNIAYKLKGESFDKILVDAPCSMDGMMQYNRPKDFEMWSTAKVKRLQELQKDILRQVWRLLEVGGTLVYSTCTIAPQENEAVVDYALRNLPGAKIDPIEIDLDNRIPAVLEWNNKKYHESIRGCLRLKPSQNIEAFFVAKFVKQEDL